MHSLPSPWLSSHATTADATNGALSAGKSPDNDVRFGHPVFMVSIPPAASGGGEIGDAPIRH